MGTGGLDVGLNPLGGKRLPGQRFSHRRPARIAGAYKQQVHGLQGR